MLFKLKQTFQTSIDVCEIQISFQTIYGSIVQWKELSKISFLFSFQQCINAAFSLCSQTT